MNSFIQQMFPGPELDTGITDYVALKEPRNQGVRAIVLGEHEAEALEWRV